MLPFYNQPNRTAVMFLLKIRIPQSACLFRLRDSPFLTIMNSYIVKFLGQIVAYDPLGADVCAAEIASIGEILIGDSIFGRGVDKCDPAIIFVD